MICARNGGTCLTLRWGISRLQVNDQRSNSGSCHDNSWRPLLQHFDSPPDVPNLPDAFKKIAGKTLDTQEF